MHAEIHDMHAEIHCVLIVYHMNCVSDALQSSQLNHATGAIVLYTCILSSYT